MTDDTPPPLNGAEALVRSLLASGVDTCFANPGTSEMHFVAALDKLPAMRCVPTLDEGVVGGAVDGYARMAGRPAATLLHCGPGLANALANLHNTKRARSPVVNLVGDQASHHRPLDPPLAAETENLARTVSVWTRTCAGVQAVGADAAAAVAAARSAPGGIASLILPSDVCWNEGASVAAARAPVPPAGVGSEALRRAARVLRSGAPSLLLVGGPNLAETPLRDAARIAAATGCRLLAPMSNARMSRGAGRPAIERVPYGIDHAVALFAPVRHVILVNATAPVGFFAYPGKPATPLAAGTEVHVLAQIDEDGPAALAALAEHIGAPPFAAATGTGAQAAASGGVTPDALGRSIAALLPEHAVVVDEGVTSGRLVFPSLASAAQHDWLQLMGGAIGEGIPMATGAAIAAPGRRVVGLQADGSALYTLQGLWTQAREKLDVTTVIFSNRRYAILQGELAAVGAKAGAATTAMFELMRPDLDWVKLAGGFGVEAARADSMERFNELFALANQRPGPFLIEAVL